MSRQTQMGHYAFFYATFFTKIFVASSLLDFEKELLSELNVAPA